MPKTAYDMRISDWSSDVCSSDLCVFVNLASELVGGFQCGLSWRDSAAFKLATWVLLIFSAGGVVDVDLVGRSVSMPFRKSLPNRDPRGRFSVFGFSFTFSGSAFLGGEGFGFAFSTGFGAGEAFLGGGAGRSEEHTSELQSLMRISYAVFCL